MHRFRLQLILALIVSVTVVSVASTYFEVLEHRHVLRQELESRIKWMGISILPDVESILYAGDPSALPSVIQLLKNGTGALALAVYDQQGHLLASAGAPEALNSVHPSTISRASEKQTEISTFGKNEHYRWLEMAFPLVVDNQPAGSMVLLADASYITAEANAVWRRSFWRILISVVLIAVITAVMLSWFLTRPLARLSERLRRLRTGSSRPLDSESAEASMFTPIERELTTMARHLRAARAAATAEASLRQSGENWWTAEKLSLYMHKLPASSCIYVVSNREPYMHVREGNEVVCMVPPSGLVTAIEPVLRACDGVWIAHGSGNADAETVDRFDHIRVPPDDPRYTLRRVWLSAEEEARYYDGFANEGLWPLCHIAHTRPIFRPGDWESYQQINQRFATALLAEMEDCASPIVFVQDYHFALLSRLVKRARPDARVALFWHIPWPNPEVFGICPWQSELVDGLLGADLIGFHTPMHCHNFLSTVDRALEARTSHEQLTTRRNGHLTTVRAYPISVAVESSLNAAANVREPSELERERAANRERLLQPLGVSTEYLAVGIERLDYTKGIEERFFALEELLERHPEYRERLTVVQVAAPSRTRIPSYANLRERVEQTVERINSRYRTAHWRPIVLITRNCSHEEVRRWYSAANLCLVTSLHDGMNLVAKEFVATRDDEDGVLILSKFAGAAGELPDALIVNPYDIAGVAGAMHRGLQMNAAERRERMRTMRRYVHEHNIYLWASLILGDLRELRIDRDTTPSPVQSIAAAADSVIPRRSAVSRRTSQGD